MVTLVVGSGVQKEYNVQRALLINSSARFKKALDGNWKEGKESRLQFPDTEIDVVEQFFCFLIRGEVQPPKHSPDTELLPVRLWAFADKYIPPKLQNQVIAHVHESYSIRPRSQSYPTRDPVYPPFHTIAEALEVSSPGSALFTLMVSYLVGGLCFGMFSSGEDPKYTDDDLEIFERSSGRIAGIIKASVLCAIRFSGNRREPDIAELMVKED